MMEPGAKTLVRMRFGSQLYGTATPTSDTDFKIVALPSLMQMIECRLMPSEGMSTKMVLVAKNAPEDVDTERFYLHGFLRLLCQGQTVALDMVHAPREFCEQWSEQWQTLVDNRHRFYTKRLDAFVGYARKQAAKYGLRGSRLGDAEMVRAYLRGFAEDVRLEDVWDGLPTGDHAQPADPDPKGVPQFQICGRLFGARARVGNALAMLDNFIATYGERARLAMENKGIDWKAVSHALRAAYQVRELLMARTISFPRPEADYLRRVKQGELHYANEVSPVLEELMAEVEALSAASDLPEKPDRAWAKEFLAQTMWDHLRTFFWHGEAGEIGAVTRLPIDENEAEVA